MKYFISIISMLMIMSATVTKADDIKIAELNWQSGSMIANIDAYILKHGYGHDTELVPGGIDATIASMMATGSPNIFGEAWTSLLGDEATANINSNTSDSLVQLRDEVVVGAGEGWYVPDYIVEQYGLTTIEQVLARPDLFPHPEDSSKGGIVICPEGWSCKKHNENLFRAFDMEAKGWKIIDPGSGTGLNAYWEGQVLREKGVIGYYWAPTVLVGRLGMVKLDSDFEYDSAHWSNCIAQLDCADAKPMNWPSAATGTIVTPNIDSAVADYLTARGLTGDVITSMLVWADDNQATAEDMAVEFLKQHPEIWTTWVTPEAADSITESLQ